MRDLVGQCFGRGLRVVVWVMVLGCSDAFAPEDVNGTYMLSAPMPVTFSGDVATRLVADTLFIAANRTARRHHWFDTWLVSGGDTTRQMSQDAYTYRLEASAIGFLWQCPPLADCAASERDWYDVLPGAGAIRPRSEPGVLFVRISAAAP